MKSAMTKLLLTFLWLFGGGLAVTFGAAGINSIYSMFCGVLALIFFFVAIGFATDFESPPK